MNLLVIIILLTLTANQAIPLVDANALEKIEDKLTLAVSSHFLSKREGHSMKSMRSYPRYISANQIMMNSFKRKHALKKPNLTEVPKIIKNRRNWNKIFDILFRDFTRPARNYFIG